MESARGTGPLVVVYINSTDRNAESLPLLALLMLFRLQVW